MQICINAIKVSGTISETRGESDLFTERNKRIGAVASTFKKHRKGISRAERVLIGGFHHPEASSGAGERYWNAFFQQTANLELSCTFESPSDVIILLRTELAALSKLHAAGRFCEALNALWQSVATITNLWCWPTDLKQLTIIHKFLFRLYFRAFIRANGLAHLNVVNILVSLSRRPVWSPSAPVPSSSFVYYRIYLTNSAIQFYVFRCKIYKSLPAFIIPYIFVSITQGRNVMRKNSLLFSSLAVSLSVSPISTTHCASSIFP